MTEDARLASDYERIATAIRFIEANGNEQPSLSEVAAEVGLSDAHFQRLFQRWAGVSPKRFLQFLTATHARRLLEDRATVLETAAEVGLSGGGRLHDLTVTFYAMTPGQIQDLAEGLVIHYGIHETPFGRCLIAKTKRGICNLFFIEENADALEELRAEWPLATLLEDSAGTAADAKRAFSTEQTAPGGYARPIVLDVRGTNFQVRVWQALVEISPGELLTYGELAGRIGAPGAARAVGTSVGRNPVSYIIPCHRVIRSTGAFGEYRWGSTRKKAMLAREAALLERDNL